MDCGSGPRGWIKYLSKRTVCDEVYSVDTGEMDDSFASSPNVRHLRMTAAEAIPKLRYILSKRDDDARLALWLSDMRVHGVPMQAGRHVPQREG